MTVMVGSSEERAVMASLQRAADALLVRSVVERLGKELPAGYDNYRRWNLVEQAAQRLFRQAVELSVDELIMLGRWFLVTSRRKSGRLDRVWQCASRASFRIKTDDIERMAQIAALRGGAQARGD